MLRGFYNAAQGMIVKQRQIDTISNNITNSTTAGYRKDEAVLNTFKEMLGLVNNRRQTSGTFAQTYVDFNKTNLEQSNFNFTDSTFDIGLYGNVYFTIANDTIHGDPQVYQSTPTEDETDSPNNVVPPQIANVYQRSNGTVAYQAINASGYEVTENGGNLLTRNGQFELDGDGYLCLNAAGRVQGLGGDIYLGTDNFTVDEDGAIYTFDADNRPQYVDTLLLTYIPPEADVTKVGDNLYKYTGEETLPIGEGFTVIQGAYEMSNVDVNKEVTRLMAVQRLFEANSAVLKQLDTQNAKSASLIGLAKI
ncbi:MAG: flagellar basal body protein [Oscillospiraceae bacterium]|jgi:flagellar basal body rod protein FlgG|nr:flagellar basal body protein [Oscillospiraceae bacterium]